MKARNNTLSIVPDNSLLSKSKRLRSFELSKYFLYILESLGVIDCLRELVIDT